MRRSLAWTFSTRRAWLVALAGASGYALLYLLIARAIIVDPGAGFGRLVPGLPHLEVAPALSWRYLFDAFDPPAVVYLADMVALAIPVPILATALVIGALVGTNLAVAVETALRPALGCSAGRPWWAVGVLPSFVAAFSCCAPTVLLLLGANAAVAVVAFLPFAVPLAVALLLLSLGWSLSRIEDPRRAGQLPGAP